MIRLKNPAEMQRIREASEILREALERLEPMVQDGVSTGELDRFARDVIRGRGAEPAFLGYMNYPASLCVSINDEVIHGIPSRKRVLGDGDIVSLDFGVVLDGYYGDSARTLPVVVGGAPRYIAVQRRRHLVHAGQGLG